MQVILPEDHKMPNLRYLLVELSQAGLTRVGFIAGFGGLFLAELAENGVQVFGGFGVFDCLLGCFDQIFHPLDICRCPLLAFGFYCFEKFG